jgi:hypothetical protein
MNIACAPGSYGLVSLIPPNGPVIDCLSLLPLDGTLVDFTWYLLNLQLKNITNFF